METPQAEPSVKPGRRPSPAWIAAGAIAALVIALLIYGLVARPAAPLVAGSPAPDFQLYALDGTPIGLQPGQVVVLNFFASWCDPCQREAPALEQVWRDYQDRGVQFYGIAYKDAASKAQAFLDRFGVTYPSGADPTSEIANDYGVTGVPETFVIDQQGRLVHQFVGEITADQLIEKLDPLLGQ
jgi:cytochrome c biogenesis protein CcmG/thiol:disulfide interchange protein DsbE